MTRAGPILRNAARAGALWLMASAPALAQDVQACLFDIAPNAAIPGNNKEILRDLSAAACMQACSDRSWCLSADFERAEGQCYLQDVNAKTKPLRRDFDDNPYDHFACATRAAPDPVKVTSEPEVAPEPVVQPPSRCNFEKVPNAGIPGNNREILQASTSQQCKQSCEDRSWCKSVDYERKQRDCYLQEVDMTTATLKYDYDGNPYDHYSCLAQ